MIMNIRKTKYYVIVADIFFYKIFIFIKPFAYASGFLIKKGGAKWLYQHF